MLRRSPIVRSVTWCALAAAVCAYAQQPVPPPATTAPAAKDGGPVLQRKPDAPQTTTLSLDARLVNLPVLVRDKKGALVSTLTKDDFTLSVDGHTESIRYFDKDNDLPLTVGLLVDVSQSMRNAIDEERTSSSSFLDKLLTAPEGRAPDRAFLMQFSAGAELLQDITPSRPKLQAALKEIGTTNPNAPPPDQTPDTNDSNSSKNSNNPHDPHGGSTRHGHGTTLYDAVFLAAEEVLKKQTGRKAIVLLTDGMDSGSKESLNRSIEAAQRADIVVYAIYFKGEGHHDDYNQQPSNHGGGYPGGRGGGFPGGGGGYPGGGRGGPQHQPEERIDGKKVLDQMTGETGGRVFEESRKETFAVIYDQIAEEMRSQYRLGFTPDKAIMEDGYHQIDLLLPKKKDLRIQTRDGYYTGQ